MSNNVDISPKKSMFILVVVIGCFSILWPKVFYPMLVGSANQQMKPSSIDKTSGCCDVISENDVKTIKIMTDLCSTIVQKTDNDTKQLFGKDLFTQCRAQVLAICSIDIDAFLQVEIKMGRPVKRILEEVRSLNGSLCLKYNFGIAPWRLGVPHRITIKFDEIPSIRQERPTHLSPEMLHPALRERGRAIPASSTPPPRVLEGRPGPIPGMRPPMGGAGHVVPASTKGTSTMSVVMPIYTIGIVIFFTYTLMKLMFKKPMDTATNGLYPTVQPEPTFRKQVFEAERSHYASRNGKEDIATKLGWKERDTIVNAMSALLAEVDQQHEEDVRLRNEQARQNGVTSNGDVANAANISNGNVSSGYAEKKEPAKEPEHDPTSVKVLGVEITASCEGGHKWSRPNTPLVTATPPPAEPMPPPQSIYLEGALPAQSQLLVSDSATETEMSDSDTQENAVVLSGKMTLSVISLDNIDKVLKNGTDLNNDEDDIEVEEIMDDDDGILEESKYTTASNATAAENDISEDEGRLTDEEQEEEIEED